FRPHVALSSKSSHQIVPRCQRRHNGPLWHRFLYCLQVFSSGMQKEMDVGVNQTRQQSAIAKVDNSRASWVFNRRARFDDATSLYEYFAPRDNASAIDIKQACGVQDSYSCGRSLTPTCGACGKC